MLAGLLLGGCAQNKVGLVPEPQHTLADPWVLGFAFTFIAGFLSPLLPALLLALSTTHEQEALACGLSSRTLTWLGGISYDIYLLHPLVRVYLTTPIEWLEA
jgi:peptidoglycan/LPS O-acetylase OafA/YrhL